MCGLIGMDGGDWFPVMILSRTAGEGNRTLVFSLEGYCSTIELHPRRLRAEGPGGVTAGGMTGECRIRTCEGRSHQIYSLTPLTARETPLACVDGVRVAFVDGWVMGIVWWCGSGNPPLHPTHRANGEPPESPASGFVVLS